MPSSALTNPQAIDPVRVNGWGIDADPRNDPTYPYRDRSGDDGPGMTWTRPSQQRPEVEVLRSIEHNRLPAVVGTSTPPSGLSGVMRRAAFRYSESDWTHWLMLLGADRVNMVEGLLEDLSRGRVPNIPAEMGVRAAWTHDRERLVARAAVTMAVSAVVIGLLAAARRSRRSDRARAAHGSLNGLPNPPRRART